MSSEPDAYLVERVREALAHDPRVAELGIAVTLAPGKVLLRGDVATPERKAAAAEVASAVAGDRTVVNSITVASPTEAAAEEVVE